MMNRRGVVTLALGIAAIPNLLGRRAIADDGPASRMTAYVFSFKALSGPDIRLADFAGRSIMVVNTASLCGYTPQYAGLQALWREFADAGLMIVGVPSNDFGSQEPGDKAEIDDTAHRQYGVTFPITAKTAVRGADAHPFYRWAAAERPKEVPAWNFHKYLLGRDGLIAEVFPSAVDPLDTRVKTAVGRALAAT